MFHDDEALEPCNTITRIHHFATSSATHLRPGRNRIVKTLVVVAKRHTGALGQWPIPCLAAARRGRSLFWRRCCASRLLCWLRKRRSLLAGSCHKCSARSGTAISWPRQQFCGQDNSSVARDSSAVAWESRFVAQDSSSVAWGTSSVDWDSMLQFWRQPEPIPGAPKRFQTLPEAPRNS